MTSTDYDNSDGATSDETLAGAMVNELVAAFADTGGRAFRSVSKSLNTEDLRSSLLSYLETEGLLSAETINGIANALIEGMDIYLLETAAAASDYQDIMVTAAKTVLASSIQPDRIDKLDAGTTIEDHIAAIPVKVVEKSSSNTSVDLAVVVQAVTREISSDLKKASSTTATVTIDVSLTIQKTVQNSVETLEAAERSDAIDEIVKGVIESVVASDQVEGEDDEIAKTIATISATAADETTANQVLAEAVMFSASLADSTDSESVNESLGTGVKQSIIGTYTVEALLPVPSHWTQDDIDWNSWVLENFNSWEIAEDSYSIDFGGDLLKASIEALLFQGETAYLLSKWTTHPGANGKWQLFQIVNFSRDRCLIFVSTELDTREEAETLLGTDLSTTAPYAYNLVRM